MEDPFELRTRLEDLMWENVGLVRSEAGMTATLQRDRRPAASGHN